jgi:hypothetical protein
MAQLAQQLVPQSKHAISVGTTAPHPHRPLMVRVLPRE